MNEDHRVEELLAEQDWDAITTQLVAFAFRRLHRRSLETAKEIAQEAITRIWDRGYKAWNPEEQPSLLEHLGSVVNGIIRNQYTAAGTRAEYLREPERIARLADKTGTPYGGREDQRIDAGAFLSTIHARLACDSVAGQVLLSIADGIDRPREQAEYLKRPVGDIYNAKRRLLDHVAAIARNQE